jgi:uncharacterized integral membrane protein (TIGR00698 family)
MLPGLALTVAIAAAATVLGGLVPIVGAPVFAMLAGGAIATLLPLDSRLQPGSAFAAKQLLQWSIVLLGAHLSLREIAGSGLATLPIMLASFVLVLAVAFFAGGWLGLDRDLRRLLGIGTAICGGSAIAALSSVIDADAADVSYALGTVFLFNVVAVVVFPALGHALGLSQRVFGVWAGTSINDTSSVVAASFAFGPQAGATGVIVKLTRTTLIVPVVLFYAWRSRASATGGGKRRNWAANLPWFILWFLLAALLNSAGLIPAAFQGPLQAAALFAITAALAGVGLGTDLERIRAAGWRPLLLGAILWAVIAVAGLAMLNLWPPRS